MLVSLSCQGAFVFLHTVTKHSMFKKLAILKWDKAQARNPSFKSIITINSYRIEEWISYCFMSVTALVNFCKIIEKSDQLFHTSSAICWDQWFPEAARAMVLQGAELLFYPTAIGSEPQDEGLDSRDHWKRVMQGHAGANLVS